jgi:FtsH-binding integral membrane protein
MNVEESQRYARKTFGILGVGLFLALAVVAWAAQP